MFLICTTVLYFKRFICDINFIAHLKKLAKRSRAAVYLKTATIRGPHNFPTRAAVCTPLSQLTFLWPKNEVNKN